MSIKRLRYNILNLFNDYNAVKKGRVGRRIGRQLAVAGDGSIALNGQ